MTIGVGVNAGSLKRLQGISTKDTSGRNESTHKTKQQQQQQQQQRQQNKKDQKKKERKRQQAMATEVLNLYSCTLLDDLRSLWRITEPRVGIH